MKGILILIRNLIEVKCSDLNNVFEQLVGCFVCYFVNWNDK